jgi:rubredoxin
MNRYQCQVCAHIYDPKAGDPAHGIPPGTKFEDLPEEWVCPICSSPRAMYEPMQPQNPA